MSGSASISARRIFLDDSLIQMAGLRNYFDILEGTFVCVYADLERTDTKKRSNVFKHHSQKAFNCFSLT